MSGEAVTIGAIDACGERIPVGIADADDANVVVAGYQFRHDELLAALIVATGQRGFAGQDSYKVSGALPFMLDGAHALLIDRGYPLDQPERWEMVPVTDVVPGNVVRWNGDEYELSETSRRRDSVSLYYSRADGTEWLLTAATSSHIERKVQP